MLDVDKKKLRKELTEAQQEFEKHPDFWPALGRVARCLYWLGDLQGPAYLRQVAKAVPLKSGRAVSFMRVGNYYRLAGDSNLAREHFERAYSIMSKQLADGDLGLEMAQMAEGAFLLGRYEEVERLTNLFRENKSKDTRLRIFSVARLARAWRMGDAELAEEVAKEFEERIQRNRSQPSDGGDLTLWDWYEIALQPVPAAEGEIEGYAEQETDVFSSVQAQRSSASNLSGPDMQGRDLRGADLSGEELMEANLKEADLTDADLEEAALGGADLRQAVLRGANLGGPDLYEALLAGADLREANLDGASLDGADLREADLREADLSDASLAAANLEGAKLKGANLYAADLQNAILCGLDLREVRGIKDAGYVEADLSEANLRGVNLGGAYLKSADLGEADLSAATLSAADLFGANLQGANLKGANLAGADLRSANLTGADLTGADLRGAKLDEADFEEAIMDDLLR